MPELLARFFRSLQAIEDERAVARAILEAGEFPEGNGAMPLRRSADGHDRERMRGLPIVGRPSGGDAIPGTNPVAALLRTEPRNAVGRRAHARVHA